MSEELYRNKLHIESPTSISLGHITWFGLDTKMVGRIKALIEELEFEKATNKELLSTGADLENKLYEEQDKNKRLNNIINELEKWLKDYIKLFDEPDMLEEQTCEDLKEVLDKLQELKGSDK